MKYKLSDEVLAAFVQLFQLALLTGTDISDHLRLLEVEPDPTDVMPSVEKTSGRLMLTKECREQLQRNVDDLDKRARELAAELPSDEA